MNLRCLFKAHEPLRLNVINKEPLIKISDATGELVHVEMCIHCKQLYWVAVQPKVKWEGKQNSESQ